MKHPQTHPLIGTTTVGEKGQVVIPADIRDSMNLKKGEKLLVFARDGGLGLVRPQVIEPMIKQLSVLQDVFKKGKRKTN